MQNRRAIRAIGRREAGFFTASLDIAMDSRYAQRVGEFLDEFRARVHDLPSVQLLPLATTEDMTARVSAAPTVFDVNLVFWSDQLATLETWRSILAWRTLELLDASVALRDEGKLVACAPVARAAFELAQTSSVTSGRLWEVIKQITPERLREQSCFSTTFPDDIELALFGTTIQSRIDETGVQRAPKLAKSRRRLQEHKLGGEISKYYEKISDLAHPYWLGNRPFYRRSNAGTIEQISREYDGTWTAEIGEDLNTVLSWTAKAASNVMDQTASGLRKMRAAFADV